MIPADKFKILIIRANKYNIDIWYSQSALTHQFDKFFYLKSSTFANASQLLVSFIMIEHWTIFKKTIKHIHRKRAALAHHDFNRDCNICGHLTIAETICHCEYMHSIKKHSNGEWCEIPTNKLKKSISRTLFECFVSAFILNNQY